MGIAELRRRGVLTLFLVGSLVLASCDIQAAGNTAILNANSAIPPTVRYTFEYTSADVTDGGQVEVVSNETDNLGTTLSENGFTRNDVVSARIDSVVIERLSAPTFGYITGASIHLGPSTSAPRIATGEFQTDQESALLNVTTRTVTNIVKQGATKAFAQLDTEGPNSVPGVDRVRATVYFELKVRGV